MSKYYQLVQRKCDRNSEVRQLTALESYRKDYQINEDEAFFEESSPADKLGGEYSLWKTATHTEVEKNSFQKHHRMCCDWSRGGCLDAER